MQEHHNVFFILRHGQSEANVAKIISSSPATGTTTHRLTEKGHEQAHSAGGRFVEEFLSKYPGRELMIVSSDFLRAKETAEDVEKVVRSLPTQKVSLTLEPRLRERSFGTWEGQSTDHYNDVWQHDALDADHHVFQVESVNQVRNRATDVVNELNTHNHGKFILLVAHGDVLQILQTAFLRADPRSHRSLRHLENAEVRLMTPTMLPAQGDH
ncbi:putative histidine phosphatase family protein [Paratrimastix pyriformis]|uniref:Histidine phosphatase family protein n=1 Tax=Paratrimastix pyriformis TaxID=342808 RepID=A0ABQ8USS7_9EUKA|nr:putative histidine phosphatase family protein [Paratrimastix pyriformis]